MDIIGAIKAAFNFGAELLGFGKQRDAEKNAPAVQAAAAAQKEQDAQDRTRKAIAIGDLEEERREAAE